MLRNLAIKILFRLLGQTHHKLYKVQHLFGASTSGHEARKKRWERALVAMYSNKDLLDYLYYQAESDKEKIFQRKHVDLSTGARLRTLFIVYSARQAYENRLKGKRSDAQGRADRGENINLIQKVYKSLVDVV